MREISPKEVEELLKQGKQVNLIDVREIAEVETGKIPGAVNIPLGFIADRLNELNPAKEYIVVCRSGARSGRATQFLVEQGYQVSNMKGGMLAWSGVIE